MGFTEFKEVMKDLIKKAGCNYKERYEIDEDKGRYLCYTPEGLFTGNSDGNITAFFRGRTMRVRL